MVWGKPKLMTKVAELERDYALMQARKLSYPEFRAKVDEFRMQTRKFLGLAKFLDGNIEDIQKKLLKGEHDGHIERLLVGEKNTITELKNHL